MEDKKRNQLVIPNMKRGSCVGCSLQGNLTSQYAEWKFPILSTYKREKCVDRLVNVNFNQLNYAYHSEM